MASEGQVILTPIPASAGGGVEVTAILHGDEYKWTEHGMHQVECCGICQWEHDHGCDRIYGEFYLNEVSALKGWPEIPRGNLDYYGNVMRYATWLRQHRLSKTCSFCLQKFCPYEGDDGFCWDCWEHADEGGTERGYAEHEGEDEHADEWGTERDAEHGEGEDEGDY